MRIILLALLLCFYGYSRKILYASLDEACGLTVDFKLEQCCFSRHISEKKKTTLRKCFSQTKVINMFCDYNERRKYFHITSDLLLQYEEGKAQELQ